ncbi:hypothetical protein [Mycobacterium tuberculosis]|uniref:hypothetical protein n=1 Tax=Mycobacterium tuberculosis TaxID=1773 RepID=UPI000A9F358C
MPTCSRPSATAGPRWSPRRSILLPKTESGCNPDANWRADISITATGLNLLAFGGINLSVDGVAVDVAEKVAFKGFLLSDVSNFAGPHGRTRAHHLLSAAARSHADPAAAGRRSPLADLKVLREGPVDDDHLRFTTSASASRLTVKRITRSTPWN